MNKITPQVRQNIDRISKALEIYYEFFGELPDLANNEDRAELYSIYSDLKHIQNRQSRRAGV